MKHATTCKTVDLWGQEHLHVVSRKRAVQKTLFDDYEGFVEKFKPKKTTDDCYTPEEVYRVVLDYVKEKCPIEGAEVVRPFYPGGDFETYPYPEGCVVVDNPPFSIISKICRFYSDNGIKFFLFCPHLTAFSIASDCTFIVVGAAITYHNGAKVKTSFVSNLFGDARIVGDAELHRRLKNLQKPIAAENPKYKYPDNVITVSKIAYCVERGVSLVIGKADAARTVTLDSQRAHGKAIYGGGFLVSDRAAAAAAAAAKEVASAKEVAAVEWALSPRELEIVRNLG